MTAAATLSAPVIGHRGAAGLAPENTLAGFALAARLGCRMVEFDVRLSADRVAVVFHDDDLDRTTDGTGPVKHQTLAALQRLDAGNGERIPTLAETLTLCLRLDLAVNIEIKPDRGDETETARITLEQTGRLWPADGPAPLISSFSRPALACAQTIAPRWPRALLVDRLPAGWERAADRLDCTAVHAEHSRLTAERVAQITRTGRDVRAYTVNSKARAEKLWFRGVSGVFSDRPDFIGVGLHAMS